MPEDLGDSEAGVILPVRYLSPISYLLFHLHFLACCTHLDVYKFPMMATQDEERKASTASAPDYGLANEDDAAVLGTLYRG